MKTKLIGWLIGSAAVMLLLPWAAVTFAQSDAGMAVTLLLFFAIDPIYSIISGIFTGKHIKELWSLPVMAAVLFLLGAWISFDPGEGAFVIYAGIYLVIGIVSMLLSSRLNARKQQLLQQRKEAET